MNARPDPMTLSRPILSPAPQEGQATSPPRNADIPLHDARDLTGRSGQAQIMLDGQVYSLRITRAGKLILTK